MTMRTNQPDHEPLADTRRRRPIWWRFAKWAVPGMLIVFAFIQFVPYGRDHTNPPETHAVQWDSSRTEALFSAACMDCHSNQTSWPLYSNIAPVSWLVQRDVDEGRSEFNISERGGLDEAPEAAKTIQEGDMPPMAFSLAHPRARLSDAERQDLINGLIATFGED
jgi:mono/diheme cytochrome c family protein